MQRNHPMCRPIACLVSAIGSLLVTCCSTALAQNLVMLAFAVGFHDFVLLRGPRGGDQCLPPGPGMGLSNS